MVRVQVAGGTLEGEVLDLVTGEGKYYSFKGIPYATPPVGKLRFKAPLPLRGWSGVKDAKKHGPVCSQYDLFRRQFLDGSDDCLYLNVYSPEITPDSPLPVMVWIHGGGFFSGSGDSDFYGPDFLVQHRVILVTINYRVAALGFLCLNTKEVPGNAGMKDQVAALHWVKENIEKFGGDPNNVTIFGESAGAASVGFHLISPMSKGLFRRAILQSGSCICDWGYSFQPQLKAFALGKILGFTGKDPNELLLFLQRIPAKKINETSMLLPITLKEKPTLTTDVYWNVSREKVFADSESFLPFDTLDGIKSIHDVEIMIGYNADEGLIFIKDLDKQAELLDMHLDVLVPPQLALKYSLLDQLDIGRKIKDYYFSGGPVTTESVNEISRYCSALMFTYQTTRFLRKFRQTCKSPAYFYKFSCQSERNSMTTKFINDNAMCGVAHADDLMYLFNVVCADLPLVKSSVSYNMIVNMTKLWTNFAKYGNPTPDDSLGVTWAPYSLENEEFLDIGEKLTPGFQMDKEDNDFWDQLYNEYKI